MNQKGFAAPLIILGAMILIVVAVGAFYFGRLTLRNPVITPGISKPSPTPSPVTDKITNLEGYECPSDEWINCMPVLGGGIKYESPRSCSQNYLNWAKANCPNFKGAAY